MEQSHKVYQARFGLCLLHPRHWGSWAIAALLAGFAFVPVGARDRFAAWVAAKLFNARCFQRAKRHAHVNLRLCFPDHSEAQREALLRDNLRSFLQIMLGFAELSVRSRAHIQSRVRLHGWDNLAPHIDNGDNLVLLVPHSYGVDYGGMFLGSLGLAVSCMFRPTRNAVFDYLMSRQRARFKSLVFERDAGFRALVKATRGGHPCFYLPDEDHGPALSVFAPFFATQKATLPSLGSLARLADAKVVPMYVCYDDQAHRFDLYIEPQMDAFPSGCCQRDAAAMNQQLERLIGFGPEQYMWTLKLFKTRPDRQPSPYA